LVFVPVVYSVLAAKMRVVEHDPDLEEPGVAAHAPEHAPLHATPSEAA
jgi:hypothetical protein